MTSPGCSPPVLSPVEASSPPFTNENQQKGWPPKKREPSVVYFQARGASLDEEIEREEAVYTNKSILRVS